MTLAGLIALITGTLGVWLTIKQNIFCWPVSLIAVLVSILEFFNERLYGDMALQVFYFFAGVYGWIFWKKNSGKTFIVTHAGLNTILILIVLTIAQVFVYYNLLRYFRGDRPFFDAILTAGSLSATYMMTRKWIENWMAWVLIDGAYVALFALKSMWLFALLYLFFTVMAFYGWMSWRKTASSK